jgi:hypothetical protein
MRQRTYPQVKPADPAATSASALQAVQVALDRRDSATGGPESASRTAGASKHNGGDAHADDDE